MARYTGPKWKLSRRENFDVSGNSKWRKRQSLPGVHPTLKGRPSNYAIQFREKQKVKRVYHLSESQFAKIYQRATKETGNTGLRLLQLLELRLDNIIYKLGLAKSIYQARQFVSHGHVQVNGKRLNIPSYTANVGDEIELHDKFRGSDVIKAIKEDLKNYKSPEWLADNKVKSLPTRDMIDKSFKENLIIEYYSR